MEYVVGILVGSDAPSQTIKYVKCVEIQRDAPGDNLIFTENIESAQKFNTIESARMTITSSSIVFRIFNFG